MISHGRRFVVARFLLAGCTTNSAIGPRTRAAQRTTVHLLPTRRTGDCHLVVVYAPYRARRVSFIATAQAGKPEAAYLVTTAGTGVCIIAMTNNHKSAIVRVRDDTAEESEMGRARMQLRPDTAKRSLNGRDNLSRRKN